MIRAPMAPGERKPTKKEERKKIAEENRARKAAMLDPSKTKEYRDKIIKEAWTDQERGFGSKTSLLRDVKQMDPVITTDDVNDWWDRNRERKNKMYAYNSFVPPHALYELQVDLFYYKYKQKQNEKRPKRQRDGAYGILAVDPFTKYIHVEPVDRMLKNHWIKALKKIFEKMGTPKVMYSDPDASIGSTDVQKFLASRNVNWVRTKNHAQNAERAIRTIKRGLDERLENLGEDKWDKWYNFLPQVLHKYNNVEKSSVTNMTAEEAKKPENEAEVKTQLAMHAVHKRKYPDLQVGDYVLRFKKKKTFSKERVSTWEDGHRIVKAIKEAHGQKFYKLDNTPPNEWYIRANLWRLPESRQENKKAVVFRP